jgi:hypothetical protein
VKKPECPVLLSSVAELLRRVEKSGDEWPKGLFLSKNPVWEHGVLYSRLERAIRKSDERNDKKQN